MFSPSHFSIFFFNATATTEIYTLSLHDALPIFNLLLNACQAGGSPVTVTAEPLGAVCRISVFDRDRKSTRLNSSHSQISYAVFCLKKKITIAKGQAH